MHPIVKVPSRDDGSRVVARPSACLFRGIRHLPPLAHARLQGSRLLGVARIRGSGRLGADGPLDDRLGADDLGQRPGQLPVTGYVTPAPRRRDRGRPPFPRHSTFLSRFSLAWRPRRWGTGGRPVTATHESASRAPTAPLPRPGLCDERPLGGPLTHPGDWSATSPTSRPSGRRRTRHRGLRRRTKRPGNDGQGTGPTAGDDGRYPPVGFSSRHRPHDTPPADRGRLRTISATKQARSAPMAPGRCRFQGPSPAMTNGPADGGRGPSPTNVPPRSVGVGPSVSTLVLFSQLARPDVGQPARGHGSSVLVIK